MKKTSSFLSVTLLILGMIMSAPIVSEAGQARIKGTMRAVDLGRRTVTIAGRSDTVTVKAGERTEITLNGQAARLQDLQAGDKATAKYDRETMVASKIDARGPERQPMATVEGTLSGIDTEGSAVVIDPLPGSGDPLRLSITAATSLTLDGTPATLAEMASGFGVVASHAEGSSEAAAVSAESLAQIRGIIRDVSVAAKTITIDPLSGESNVTLNVVEGTTLSLNGRPATLEDLARGYRVRASYDPATFNARRVDAMSLLEILGQIRAVSIENSTVTIAPLMDTPPVELQVVHSTVITINGEPAGLDRLQPGMTAKAIYNLASLVAERIDAKSEGGGECTVVGVTGEIARVGVESNTLVIKSGESGEYITLNITERTEITLNGRPARLQELTPGMKAGARFCRETLNALGVQASDHRDECTVVGVEGAIARVSVEESKLVINPARGGEPVTLEVTARTEITLDGHEARLGDLRPGMRVAARFCRETMMALGVAAQSGGGECTVVSVSGEIARVSTEEGKLVIDPREGEPLTLNVTERTEIVLNGRPARLADLQPGMKVSARFCRESLNALAIVATSDSGGECTVVGVQGEIARVSAEEGKLAIAPLGGGEVVTLNVTDRTEIALNDRPARLSDLQPGMKVASRFCRESLNALAVAAFSPTPGECSVVSVEGQIARVHLEEKMLVIAPAAGGELAALNITERTEIALNNRPARLSDLQPGMRVAARFCRESHNALAVAAFSPIGGECTVVGIEGQIARVSVPDGKLAVTPSGGGEPVTLNVTDRTEIFLNDRPARLSDLAVGMKVGARFCRETLNALSIHANAR